jgi:hypothetical protein
VERRGKERVRQEGGIKEVGLRMRRGERRREKEEEEEGRKREENKKKGEERVR